jgi:hypothetical protein
MKPKTKNQDVGGPSREADKVEDLAKIAFGNIGDFAQFRDDGEIVIDHAKAREAGAKVSVVDRKLGKGKNARRLRRIAITMPNKTRALMLLGKQLGLFKNRKNRS